MDFKIIYGPFWVDKDRAWIWQSDKGWWRTGTSGADWDNPISQMHEDSSIIDIYVDELATVIKQQSKHIRKLEARFLRSDIGFYDIDNLKTWDIK